MSKDSDLEALSHPEFWDNRYASEQKQAGDGDGTPTIESFEWFRDFRKLRAFFEKHLPEDKGKRLLHLGCGNSTLTSDLHGLGYTNQLSVDFSQVLIAAMTIKYASLTTTWVVMDVRHLDIPDATVDVAIDKGTLDAFIHGSLWDPPADVRENVGLYVDEVARVLKPGGTWLYITYRQPHFMKPLLLREDKWNLEVEVLEDPDGGGGFEYFSFVMTRHKNETT